jgi:PAS domain S-box-containing protein
MRMKVLVVDNEPEALELSRTVLGDEQGFEVETASSTADALEKLVFTKFDAVITEWKTSAIDALAILNGLRSRIAHVIFVVLTSRSSESSAISALNNGTNLYLRKGADLKAQYIQIAEAIRDITRSSEDANRRLIDDAQRVGEETYRTFFETTGTATVIVNEDSTIYLANQEFEKMSGYRKDEVEGKMKWTDLISPEDLDRVYGYHVARMTDPAAAPRTYEFRARDKEGNPKFALATVAVIPGGKRTLVSIVDLTERRRYEEALQLVNEKLNILGSITRHDILNELSVLYAYLQMSQESVESPAVGGFLAKARIASETIRKHLEFARDYQSMGTRRPEWIPLRQAYSSASSPFETKDVTLSAQLHGVEVFADPMLEKVFYNLIDNAIRHGEKVARVKFRYEERPDGMAIICEDDGIGVSAEEKTLIFERGHGKHTGYGLYLSREILGITGLTIREVGQHGVGAVFEINVPRGKFRFSPKEIRRPLAKKKVTRPAVPRTGSAEVQS